MTRLEVKELVLHGAVDEGELALLVERVRREARKQNVDAARFTLSFEGGLTLEGEARERGAVFAVDFPSGRRRYALTVDGVETALADVVRVLHGGDALMLEAYERVLHGRLGRRP